MRVVLGPFHPYLENAFVEEIVRLKSANPLCPLLTLVPSDALRRRVKILLARERRLSFIHLPILTFHQLSLRLFAEAHGALSPALYNDLFFEEALRQLIRAKKPGTAAFYGLEERSGGCAALWQTLRDLRDGLVDPVLAREALCEGHFAQRTSQRTADLLELFETLLCFCSEHAIQDDSDLARSAAARAPASSFLRRFNHIFYYGFYDLTQIQMECFEAVARHHPTMLFFPLLSCHPPHAGWRFAERFYQRYVQGRGGDEVENLLDEPARRTPLGTTLSLFDQEPRRTFEPLPDYWRCTIFNAFGIYDEISAVAKQIVRLIDNGVPVDEIGVVARALDSYGAVVKEVFTRHRIPIGTTIEEPLAQFPLTKAAALLLNLPARGYLRPDVMELLSSPYFRFNSRNQKFLEFRADLCDLATRELAICKGLREWERLKRYATKDLILSQISSDEAPRIIRIPAAELRALWATVNGLAAEFSRLPPSGSWSEYAELWKQLLQRYLGIAPNADSDGDSDAQIGNEITAILDQMGDLDVLQVRVLLADFSRTFQQWLGRSTFAPPAQKARGVTVLNATAARGLKFRALFIIGLNEGVFPRTIREDAFLRDRDREVLERDLGYKISQKLAGFDEEKLLFTLLVNAATEHLYCSFQRADESGRVLAPSWYVAELKRALGAGRAHPPAEETIPRAVADKGRCAPFSDENLLLPEELAIRLSMAGEPAVSLMQAARLSPDLYRQGITTVARLDLTTQHLDEYDGMVTGIDAYRRLFSRRGFSPTALELYRRCPFQYFARQVIGLERLQAPEESAGPSVAEYGELGHAILKATYEELIHGGYFMQHGPLVTPDASLTAAAQRAFAQYESEHPVGYPLAWEIVRQSLTETISAVIDRDLKELHESGYVPIALETDIADQLPADWPQPLPGLAIRGRMDRIDIDEEGRRLRVVDYKFKVGLGPAGADRDLRRAALRGERWQPPVYTLLGERWAALKGKSAGALLVETTFFYIAPKWKDGPLLTRSFSSNDLCGKMGDEIKDTLARLVKGIQSGHFFMQRGSHCQYCEVAEICRKNHPPSLWRAENDPIAQAHRRLHDKDLKEP